MLGFLPPHDLLPRLLSAQRRYHSTKTEVLKLRWDIMYAIDADDLSALALFDLLGAFACIKCEVIKC